MRQGFEAALTIVIMQITILLIFVVQRAKYNLLTTNRGCEV